MIVGNIRQRNLINFLVLGGISFIKSISEIVETVWPSNVFHMITNNESNYKDVGKLLFEKYLRMSWSFCEAHFLNLKMEDIEKIIHMKDLITLVSRVNMYFTIANGFLVGCEKSLIGEKFFILLKPALVLTFLF